MKVFICFFFVVGALRDISIYARRAVPVADVYVGDIETESFPIFGGGAECNININGDLAKFQPLFVNSRTKQFIIPDKTGTVKLQSGDRIDLHCSDSFDGDFQGTTQISPLCVRGKEFATKGKKHNFKQFQCKSYPRYEIKKTDEACADGAGTVAYVGFNVNQTFLPTMDICHDETVLTTFYSRYRINPSSESFQKSVPRVSFTKGGFFGKTNVNRLYTKRTQMETFDRILNGGHEKYFEKSAFLSRGHLSAKSDHIFGAHQRATFNYLNVAPQWQSFNDGTWNAVEVGVRRLAAKRNLELEVYTGTWGVGTLQNETGHHKELYLGVDRNGNGQIPVPKLFYKIVVDIATRAGIALIGVNNPHVTAEQLENDYLICNDISEDVSWIRWKRNNFVKGYFFACDVNEFLRVVQELPRTLNISRILR